MPLAIRFHVVPSTALADVLSRLQPPELHRALEAGLVDSANRVVSIAKRKYLRGPRPGKLGVVTGSLLRSLRVDRRGLPFAVEIGSDLVYAPVHEFGATIRPRKAEYLHFKTRDGAWVRTKEVTIPARPFLQPALDDATPEFEQIFAKAIRRVARL